MQYRTINGTDVKLSAISFGCWTLGGLQTNEGRMIGWAPPDESEVVQAVHAALDAGVNHFDNSDAYGFGRAERMLARVLQGARNRVLIASKVGFVQGTAEHPYLPHHIRSQCEHSLVNLNRDWLDIYYLHHTDFGPNDCRLDDAVATMRRLREEGKIRLIGLSGRADGLLRTLERVKPDVVQSRASMMDRAILDEDSPAVRLIGKMKLQVVCFSPLEQGILLGKYSAGNPPVFQDGDVRKNKPQFSADGLAKIEPKIEQLKRRFGASVRELGSAALSFLLSHEHVLCPIPGFRNLRQVEDNLACGGNPMKPDDAGFVRELFQA